MMKKNIVAVAIATLAASLMAHSTVRGAAPGFQVIVHPSVPGVSIERRVLSEVFLRKAQRWGDKRRIEPVDLTSTSPVRETFTAEVLGMSTAQVSRYWMDAIPAGVFPPMTRPNDRQVIEFVAAKPGAVGYVTAGTELPASVKALSLK